MSALSPRSLAAACRAIYVQAAEDAILPPLIRDAADPAPPRRTIEVSGAEFSLSFGVLYAQPRRDALGRLTHPPLRFEIEASAGPDDVAVDLGADESFALIRAFLLGVREPVVVDASANNADWRVGFKISSRFSVWAADPVRLDANLTADQVAERLADVLLEETRGLFATPEIGRAVWKARLRQDLFADRRPAAHEIWPVDGAAPASAPLALPALAPLPAARATHRPRAASLRAFAAAVALVGLAAFAGAVASRGARGDAKFGRRATEVSDAGAQRPRLALAAQPAAEPSAPVIRPAAALSAHAPWSPGAGDARLALLAPNVADATRALSPAAIVTAAWTPAPIRLTAAPSRPAVATDDPGPAPRAIAGKAAARRAHGIGPLVHVDRAVRKFVKSVARRLPRMKFSALNSPHAAGPRGP
ncbi:MAG TPA: hypothetical protein PKA55_06165 [Rhodoblastus sp.]|nr:hypothetical protein [Rhodoblastus sp.]